MGGGGIGVTIGMGLGAIGATGAGVGVCTTGITGAGVTAAGAGADGAGAGATDCATEATMGAGGGGEWLMRRAPMSPAAARITTRAIARTSIGDFFCAGAGGAGVFTYED